MNRKQYLEQLIQRAKLLQTASASRISTALTAMRDGLSPENDQKVHELVRAAQGERAAGTRGPATMQLATLRVETVDNFIWASSNALTFFDEHDLAATEEPWLENTSKQQIKVDYIGQDGRAKKLSPIRYQQEVRVDLSTLSTEEFEYFVFDIYKGDVRTPQLASVDMGYELMMQVDGVLWPYIQSRILGSGQSFNYTTGAKSGRVFVPHTRINVNNLPTTNLLVPAGNTSTSTFRKACLDMILIYCASWGTNAFKDGPLMPVTVFLPSKDVMGLLSEIQILAQTFSNMVIEQIMETGFIMAYGGARWSFIGDSTLDPTAGIAYVKMNKSIGTFYTKKAGDKVLVDNSIEMQKQNKESVSMTKIIGAALPSPKTVNIVAIKYHN